MAFETKMTKEEVITGLKTNYGTEFTTADVKAFCAMNDIGYQTITKKIQEHKVAKGKWNLEVTTKVVEELNTAFEAPAALPAVQQNLVPDKDATFVKFGPFTDVKKIIQSKLFYPSFITGLSGNGKTFSVEQALSLIHI